MVLVSVENAQEGLVLAQNLYDLEGRLLLAAGTVLTGVSLRRLTGLGFRAIYVREDSEGSLTDDVADVMEETRLEVRRALNRVSQHLGEMGSAVEAKHLRWAVEHLLRVILERPETLLALVDVKAIPDHSFGHSIGVAVLSLLIGRELRLGKDELRLLGLGALLHDIGKTMVPYQILNKSDRLNDEEFESIKTHAELGYEVLKGLGFDEAVASTALQHHERVSGRGYPHGLKAGEIGLRGRIVAVADVFDAMTSERPYKRGIHPQEALNLILEETGTSFDPMVVEAASRVIAPYPVGSVVRLDDGSLGVVRNIRSGHLQQPEVRVYRAESGQLLSPPVDLDLAAAGRRIDRAIPWYEVPTGLLPREVKSKVSSQTG